MRDALPRLNGAFDGSDDKQIDRRHLLKMGAWAAPVIVLATAAPAAAAQSGPPTTTPYTPPPTAVAVAGGGTGMLPRFVVGGTGVVGKPYWGSFTDPANPKRLGTEINISGISNSSTARTVTVYFYVPHSDAPLNQSNPRQWVWSMGGSNFSSMSSTYESTSATTGVWRLDFVMPSWGTTSYAHLYVQLP
ncbi:hypothetical protein N3K63_02035 [Microbacterium sp. W1N]|uniref:hypothetical protein n=1 Tax=Microbacterium festucae TaxID=2977531 RepID=UPI0021BE67E3|nr:hypothetical protein [Microbacterium festucae]MCT9819060.1 hypothetical protein [Microbacterium festucae]